MEKQKELEIKTPFLKRHSLKAPSSANTALKSLQEKELIYKSTEEYVVYDHFMAANFTLILY